MTSSPDSPPPAQPEHPEDLDDACLVVPLYNEAQVVREVIEDARRTFRHIVVVDDGSRDDSAAKAEAAGAVVVRHPINLGQGAALQTGITYVLERTDARYLVTFDADGQHSTTDAAAMVAAAREEELAVILGSRFLQGPSPVGRLKRLVLRTAAAVSSRTSGMHLTDAHNGLRVIRRDVLVQLNLKQNRMAHASQIIRQLGATGLPWREQGVHIVYTDYSRAKGIQGRDQGVGQGAAVCPDATVWSGTLHDPYTGSTIEFQRGQGTSEAVQIDHVVPLNYLYAHGAWAWDQRTRLLVANDPLNLLAVEGRANQQKGAGDAATWLPPNKSYRCDYVSRQIAVKKKYHLWVTSAERNAMVRALSTCPNQPLPAR